MDSRSAHEWSNIAAMLQHRDHHRMLLVRCAEANRATPQDFAFRLPVGLWHALLFDSSAGKRALHVPSRGGLAEVIGK